MPSFVVELDQVVEVPGLGAVRYDLAFGGAYYAYVEAEDFNLSLDVESAPEIIRAGMAVKRAVAESVEITHPTESDLGFLSRTITRWSSPGFGRAFPERMHLRRGGGG